MKRIASLVLAFVAMPMLIVRASACVADGDTEGYVLAFVCGVFVFTVAILAAWVSVQWEMEMQARQPEGLCDSFPV